jgi:hypothetical protein
MQYLRARSRYASVFSRDFYTILKVWTSLNNSTNHKLLGVYSVIPDLETLHVYDHCVKVSTN